MLNKFINSFKRPGNEALIETIQKGYKACFESIGNVTFKVDKEPVHGQWDQLTPYINNEPVGRLIFKDNDNSVWIEYIETNTEIRKQGIATKMINKLRELFPGKKLEGIPTNEEAESLFKKMNISNDLNTL